MIFFSVFHARFTGNPFLRAVKLTPATSAHEAQIVELGNLVLHDGGAVPQFAAKVLVVTGGHGDHRAVADLAQGHHLERHRQGFVRAPVRGQYGADLERGAEAVD